MNITIAKPEQQSGQTLLAEAYGMHPDQECNGAALQQAIEACKQSGADALYISPGVYRFAAGRHPVFEGLRDFRLEGSGAEFVFRTAEAFMTIRHCERMEVRGLTVDWDWTHRPLASIGVVTQVDPAGAWFEMRFPEYETLPSGLELRGFNPMDERTMTPGCPLGREFGGERLGQPIVLADGTVRIPLPEQGGFAFLAPGQAYIVRHYVYDAPAFELHANRHLTLEEVTVYGAPGHAFVSTGPQHHWQLQRCRLLKRPGTTRCISATADGCHISNSLGDFRMEHCQFGGNGDDGLNIHDNSVQGFERLGASELRLKTVFSWRNPFDAGDPIEFRHPDLSPTGLAAAVVRADWDADGCTLRFDRELPEELPADAILFNRRYDSGRYIVRHNLFHDNRARGVLLHASHGLVEHNRFHRTQGPAIQIECGAESRWAEGYGVEGLTIRHNRIESCDVNHWYMAVIYMGVYLPQGRTAYPIFRDIAIEGNTIVDCPQQAIFLSSCQRVRVVGNVFLNPNAGPPKRDEEGDENSVKHRELYKGTMMASHCRDVVIADNQVLSLLAPSDEGIWLDADTASDVRIYGNDGLQERGGRDASGHR